jgi:hypothetical protein
MIFSDPAKSFGSDLIRILNTADVYDDDSVPGLVFISTSLASAATSSPFSLFAPNVRIRKEVRIE